MDHPFDPLVGAAGKTSGMARAARSCNPVWWQYMLELGQEIALRKPFLSADDLEFERYRRQGPTTHENRAMGPLMKYAARLGYWEPTQDFVESSQKVKHQRPMRVWHSLIYQGNSPIRYRRRKILDPRRYQLEWW